MLEIATWQEKWVLCKKALASWLHLHVVSLSQNSNHPSTLVKFFVTRPLIIQGISISIPSRRVCSNWKHSIADSIGWMTKQCGKHPEKNCSKHHTSRETKRRQISFPGVEWKVQWSRFFEVSISHVKKSSKFGCFKRIARFGTILQHPNTVGMGKKQKGLLYEVDFVLIVPTAGPRPNTVGPVA